MRGDATTEVRATERNAELFKQAFKREIKVVTQPLKSVEAVPQPIGWEAPPTADPLRTRVQEIMQLLQARLHCRSLRSRQDEFLS
jgi:hypothetical protein